MGASTTYQKKPCLGVEEILQDSRTLQLGVFSALLKGKDHTRMIRLCRASSITIKRYIKIRGEAHPFNPAFKEYFEKREGNKTRL
tara:strand:- start:1100 stop:1354 length:255 start_codon:yes stop_codon:yes gene_type:complete